MTDTSPLDSHGSPTARPGDPRHDQAVLQAEIRCLKHALAPFGVLNRDALEREARASRWHDGTFERALEAAVAVGDIEPLAFGFYRMPRSRLDARDR